MDLYERPELSLGSYEFIATLDYCKVTEKLFENKHAHFLYKCTMVTVRVYYISKV